MRLEIVERAQPKVTTGYMPLSNRAEKACLLLLLAAAAASNDSSQPLFATCMVCDSQRYGHRGNTAFLEEVLQDSIVAGLGGRLG